MKNILFLILTFFAFQAGAQVLRKRTVKLMGSRWHITIVAQDSVSAENQIDTVIAEVRRIEYLISDWKAETQVSEVNSNAGIRPVRVNREVFELTKRALLLSRNTNGAFDISFAAMDKVWKFDGSMSAMPSADMITKSVSKVGFKNIILDSTACTIFLKLKGMKIGFGALGEGYAADKARKMMIARGVKAGIVDGSGDMSTWGKQADGSAWTIGITNPMHPDTVMAVVQLKDQSVVTSGSYEKFVVFNGRRYSHIINPKTGYPSTGLSSVTVFGPSAETANGLSTSMMVLGKQAALSFIKRFPAYHYIMVTDKGTVLSSQQLKLSNRRIL